MIIIAIIVAAGLTGLLFLMWFIADKLEKAKVYVYKGNQYFLCEKCLIKDPATRKWVEGISYRSLKSGQLFVREENDFIVKFETYKQWKKNGRNDKGGRGSRHCSIGQSGT